ncbi:MAG: flavin reductase family protein [Methanobacteriota archaeon]
MKIPASLDYFYQYAFPMPTVLVTCNDEQGRTNIVTVAWHTTLSRKPPLYGISLASKRYSYELINKTKEYALNFIPYELAAQAQFCGTHTGRKTEKTRETNLTLVVAKKIRVPLIKEAYAHLECRLQREERVGDHILLVGEVVAVQIEENVFQNDILQIQKMQPLFYLGENSYTTVDTTKKHEF